MSRKIMPLSSWEALIEERIRAAQEAGEFSQLSGLGKPSPLIDQPYTEDWWIKGKLRREGVSVMPLSLEIRRDVEIALRQMWELPSEERVQQAVETLNEKILAANYRSVNGPPSFTPLVEVAWALQEWRRRSEQRKEAE